MNVAAPQSLLLRWVYGGSMAAFFLYLAAPLAAAAIFAFNNSLFPALPWNGSRSIGSLVRQNRS